MDIRSSETSSERFYFSHRQFLEGIGLLGAGSLLLAAYAPSATRSSSMVTPSVQGTPPADGTQTDELGDAWTSFDAITGYSDYHEFSPEKEAAAPLSKCCVSHDAQLICGP